MVLVFIQSMTVVGCGNDNVGISYEKSPQVNGVTVEKTKNNNYFIVSWDAISGDRVSYSVYFKQDEGKSSTSVGYGQNLNKYDPDTGEALPNDNLDKWSYRENSLTSYTLEAGSYCFGISATLNSYKVSTVASDIKWSDSFTVTKPQVSSITVKKTDDNEYFIASWDAVAGIDNYYVECYRRVTGNTNDWSRFDYDYGQNSYIYAQSDGAESINTDKSKWSYITSIYNTGYEYYFTVRTWSSDISVCSSTTKSSVIK